MASSRPLTPARIDFNAGEVPYAADYDDVYHSAAGGPEQSRHVFLAGNGLPERWRGRRLFTILETGFGLGLNFLCTAEAYLADPSAAERLHYVAVEMHPAVLADLKRAHARWPLHDSLAAELREHWPPLLHGFHRIELAAGRIALTLLFGDAGELLAELRATCVDAIYLDGFAPEKNPDMWSLAVFRQIGRVSVPGASAATWSVARTVRGGLQAAGFRVEKRKGFGRKREMLAGVKTRLPAPCANRPPRHALIVGAGVAGCWTAYTLARRGWNVTLVEQHDRPAREASGNAVGVLLPALNLADNANARLARAAFLWASHVLGRDLGAHNAWRRTGLLQIALTEAQVQRMALILATHGFPPEYAAWVEHTEASRLAEHPVGGPGWWIARGGWVDPARLCERLLDAGAGRIERRFTSKAHGLERAGSGWRIVDPSGHTTGEAPVVILANGFGARQLGLEPLRALVSVRGQVSYLPPAPSRKLNIVVCGDGYVAPLPDGGHCVGATFEPESTALDLRIDDHARNLARAERMLPGYASGLDATRLDGRVALRTASADRLPFCGRWQPARADAEGLHLFTGLGARGLIWAPLCAEMLASELEAEPNPVELSLTYAVDPNR